MIVKNVGEFLMTNAQKVKAYEDKLLAMEGKVFYCEDDEGVLRRWFPPRILPSTPAQKESE